MATKALLEALAVCAELTRTNLSEAAAGVMAQDLSTYPEDQVLGALTRCRRELQHGRLTIAAVIERVDDGRPGAEEAFAMIPRSERESVIWPEEAAQASAIAQPHISDGDMVAARMAFKEAYQRLVQRARDARVPVRWVPSWGWDATDRERAVIEAVSRGRIASTRALELLPSLSADAVAAIGLPAPAVDREALARIAAQGVKRLKDWRNA